MNPKSDERLFPFIPSHQNLPEWTLRALLLSVVLAVVFGAANAYLGLKIGMTVSASIPAAVMSMAILRIFFRNVSILENNLVQTSASAGESLIAGVVFVVPALFFLNLAPSFLIIFLMAAAGGILGVVMMVPLRHTLMITEHAVLPFPEGTACAEVLKTGERKAGEAGLVFKGMGIGALFNIVRSGLGLFPGSIEFSFRRLYNLTVGMELSSIMLGVGFLVGPSVAFTLFAGGILRGCVVLPATTWFLGPAADPVDIGLFVRMIGAGGGAMGGLISVVKVVPVMYQSFCAVIKEDAKSDAGESERTHRNLSPKILAFLVLFAVVLSFFSLPRLTVVFPVSYGVVIPVILLLILVTSFFFVAVSARMVGLIGTTSQPVSGMTISALLLVSVVLYFMGVRGHQGMALALCAGTIICVAICLSGDISQDLKTGALLGATPSRQQAAELAGVLVAALVAGAIVILFQRSGDLQRLPAPQAHLMADIVKAVMTGQVNWVPIGVGAGLALAVFACGASPLAFAIGLYLPVSTSCALIVGGFMRRYFDKNSASVSVEKCVLLASGLIAGEALVGVVLAGVALAGVSLSLGITPGLAAGSAISIAVYACMAAYFFRQSRKKVILQT